MAVEDTVHVSDAFISIKQKRRLTYGTILMFNLCTGLGYAIIFPTIWNYIHDYLKGKSYMLGIVISAYSFSSLFSNPLIGWWSDRSLNTRLILLVTILGELTGSVLYFVGINTWILVLGRLISGIGAGGGAAVLADITRTTPEEERTPVLSIVVASRQLGLIIGPAFNFFLSQVDFHLFSFPVNKYTSPGLFMAFLWLILEVVVMFAYHNLTVLKDNEDVEKLFENYDSIITGSLPYSDVDNSSSLEAALTSSYPPYSSSTVESVTSGMLASSSSQPNLRVEWFEDNVDNISSLKKEEIETINCQKIVIDPNKLSQYYGQLPAGRLRRGVERSESVSDRMIESAERLIQSTSGSYANYAQSNDCTQITQDSPDVRASGSNPSTPFSSRRPSVPDERTSLLGHIKQDYFRDEIVVLLGLAFISCFSQTVLETVVTPLAQKYYHFSEMDNSYIYLFSGIEAILVFSMIKYISRKVSDRCLIMFGLVTLGVAMILPLFFIPSAIPGETKTLPFFIITIIIDLIGIAVIVVCSSSLLSKLISEDNQALFQGLRRSMCSLGCIMGPLWGGTFLFDMRLLFCIPLAVTALITVLFLVSYKKLETERLEQ